MWTGTGKEARKEDRQPSKAVISSGRLVDGASDGASDTMYDVDRAVRNACMHHTDRNSTSVLSVCV